MGRDGKSSGVRELARAHRPSSGQDSTHSATVDSLAEDGVQRVGDGPCCLEEEESKESMLGKYRYFS